MTKVRVAINGFGRIGRNIFRAIYESGRKDIDVVAVNDLGPVETNAHLLQFDSVHGRFPHEVMVKGDSISIGPTSSRSPPSRTRASCRGRTWASTSRSSAPASSRRATRRRPISPPAPSASSSRPRPTAPTSLSSMASTTTSSAKDHMVISNASCTTNCLAPVAKVLNDGLGIEKGMMTTIHSYTGDQPTLDTMHKDLYRARAAALSMIPTSTGAAKAVGLVLPELKGKLDGFAMRVPTPNVSVVDLKFIAKRKTTREEVNEMIRKAAASGPLKGILGTTDKPNVSIDFNHDPHSSIFHLDQTKVMDGNFVSILSWYDNEWGFSNRMGDTAAYFGKLIG